MNYTAPTQQPFDPFSQVRSALQASAPDPTPGWAPYQQKFNQILQAKNQQQAQQAALDLQNQFTSQFPGAKVNVSNTGLKSQYGNYTAPNAQATSALQKQAQQMAAAQGWTGNEWNAFSNLIQRESGWNPNAQNPGSEAYGLGQFLNSTWAGTGYAKTNDPITQLKATFKYIQQRYGTPAKALQFWLSRRPINGKDVGNWY